MWPFFHSFEESDTLEKLRTHSFNLAMYLDNELCDAPEQEHDSIIQKHMPDWMIMWNDIPDYILRCYATDGYPLSPQYIYHLIEIACQDHSRGGWSLVSRLLYFFESYPDDVRCVIYAKTLAAFSEDPQIVFLVDNFGVHDPDVVDYLFHRLAIEVIMEHKDPSGMAPSDLDQRFERIKQRLSSDKVSSDKELRNKEILWNFTHFF